MDKSITILGIESSCDDTAAAVIVDGVILSNIVATQAVHEEFGGVVPELASRAHQQNIIPVVTRALSEAGVTKEEIDGIAFTRGPGLLGSLLVGVSFAKAFGLGSGAKLIEVNHMQAHVLAHFVKNKLEDILHPSFPFICLTVSGGHTQILVIKSHFDMKVIGQTLDDAAGEAFDKAAKMLQLPYPGGPLIDKYGAEGDPLKFNFAEPKVADLNFSFSGLKTSILYFLQKQIKANPDFISENLIDLCASIQYRIVQILINKLKKAIDQTGIKTVAIAGGVSANSALRNTLREEAIKANWKLFIPNFEYCTDNAAMIATAGHFKYLNNEFADQHIVPDPRLHM